VNGFIKFAVFAAIGIALGYFPARYIVDGHAFSGAARAGRWTVWPNAGGVGATPYSRLHFFLSGQMPPSHFNHLDFETDEDEAGRALTASCSYRLEGASMPVRWWALSIYPADSGADSAEGAGRGVAELSSFDAIYESGGKVRIHIDALARPENWLKPPAQGKMVLVLRLFNAASLSREELWKRPPMKVFRETCR